MRSEDNQKNPISGRFPEYDLPESHLSTYLKGQFLHLLSIEVSSTADFSSFFRSQFSQNLETYQKNGGEIVK